MDFGLALPQYDFSLPGSSWQGWASVEEWARRAEALGFRSVWLSDHLFYDLSRYGGAPGERRCLECFTGLGALSVVTSRVRLGSLVACNDLRHPALLAKMAATLDRLSGGRMELGMGAGWFEPEYHAAGIEFEPAAVRVERLEESVRVVRRLLAGEEVVHRGSHYRLEGALCLPEPVQPRLPVFVGGWGSGVARLAGRSGDGFNSVWSWEPDDFARRAAAVHRSASGAGRKLEDLRLTLGLYALPGSSPAALRRRWDRYLAGSPAGRRDLGAFDLWSRDKLAGSPEQIAERIGQFEAAGVDEIILTFGTLPFQICDPDAVEEFMSDVVPALAKH